MTIGFDKPLYILPFDHRGSFETKMFGWSGDLTPAQTAEIAAASNGKTGSTTGTATLWVPDSGSDLADGQSVTVTNRSLDSSLSSGTYIQVQWSWMYLEWMIVWADC